MADPRIATKPRTIRSVSYRELRELSYMGANVFHEEATFPVRQAGIPINIRNTNQPDDPGTMIVAEDSADSEGTVTGIAGRKNFTVITIEKMMMNQEVGFARRILDVLETNGISFEHMPSGIDTLSVIIDNDQLKDNLQNVLFEIKIRCQPDSIKTAYNIAMVAIVGRGMLHTLGVAARVFGAVARAGINVRMINQGSSELSIIFGVDNENYEIVIQSLYKEFIL
jgi:aspartate kinase